MPPSVTESPLSRPRHPVDYEITAERAREGRVPADYLFPPQAMLNGPGDGAQRSSDRNRLGRQRAVTPAFPRSAGRQLAYLFRQWQDRRSGEGRDAGVGTSADCILGAWSCCRNVHHHRGGCVTAPTHSTSTLRCRHCGVMYDYMDNARAQEHGNPTCARHAAEPEASRGSGAPFGDPVWPCCGAVGFRHSKYHSHSYGKSHVYTDEALSAAVPWGCKRGEARRNDTLLWVNQVFD